MSLLLMGARGAVTVGRAALTRLVLAVAGLAAVVLALLTAAAAHSVVAERADASVARSPINADLRGGGSPTGFYVLDRQDSWRGEPVTRVLLDAHRARTEPAPPPGLTAVPKPGQCVVSPALGRLMTEDAASHRELARRYCGKASATIAPAGLLEPDELLAYVGSDSLADDPDAVQITGFGAGRIALQTAEADTARSDRVLLAMVGATAVPLILMVTTCTRLAGRARARRLAALRLSGASRRQAAAVLSGEILTVTALGVALAWLVFFAVRALSQGWKVAGYGWFREDASPGPGGIAVSGLVLWLSVLVARREARQALHDPYGARRSAAPRPPRPVQLLPLLIAVLVLGFLVAFGGPQAEEFVSPAQMLLLYAGVLLGLAGLASSLPLISHRLAGPLAHRAERTWLQLAGRQARSGAGPVTRSVAALAIVMVTAGAAQLVTSTLRESEGHWLAEQLRTPAGKVVAVTDPSSSVLDAARRGRISGARATLPVQRFEMAVREGAPPSFDSVLVADCAWLDDWLGSPVRNCRANTPARLVVDGMGPDVRPGVKADFAHGPASSPDTPTFSLRVPEAEVSLPLVDGAGRLDATLLVPPGSPVLRGLAPQPPERLLIRYGNDPGAEDAVRGALLAADPHAEIESTTSQLREIRAEITPLVVATGATTFTTCALLLGVLVIAAFDAALLRARTTGMLIAAGAPSRTLRLAQACQLLLPTAAAVLCAAGLHLLVNLAVTRVTGGGVGFSVAAFGVLVVVGVLGTVVAVLPALLLRRGDTELMRAG